MWHPELVCNSFLITKVFVAVVIETVVFSVLPTGTLAAQMKIDRLENGITVMGTACDFPELTSAYLEIASSKNGRWLAKQSENQQLLVYDLRAKKVVNRFPVPSGSVNFAFHPQSECLAVLQTRPVINLETNPSKHSEYEPTQDALQVDHQSFLTIYKQENGEWLQVDQWPLTADEIPENLLPENFELPEKLRFDALQFLADGSRLVVRGPSCLLAFDHDQRELKSFIAIKKEDRLNRFVELLSLPETSGGLLLSQIGKIWDVEYDQLTDVEHELKQQLAEYALVKASTQSNQWYYGKFGPWLTNELGQNVGWRNMIGYVRRPNGDVVQLSEPEQGGPYSCGVGGFTPDGRLCVGTLSNRRTGLNRVVVWECATGTILHQGEYPSRTHRMSPQFLDDKTLLLFCNSRHYLVPLGSFDPSFQNVLDALPNLVGGEFNMDGHRIITPEGILLEVTNGQWQPIHSMPLRQVDFSCTSTNEILFASKNQTSRLDLQRYSIASGKSEVLASVFANNQEFAQALTYLVGGDPKRESWPIVEMAVSVDAKSEAVHVLVFDTFRGVQLKTLRAGEKNLQTMATIKRKPYFRLTRPIAAISKDGTAFAFVAEDGVYLCSAIESSSTRRVCDHLPRQLSFNHDGSRLACLWDVESRPGITSVEVFDVQTQKKVYSEQQRGLMFAFASDTARCIVASEDPRSPAEVLETESFEVVFEHQSGVTPRDHAFISADGERCGFSLQDGRLEVWELTSIDTSK